MYVMTHPTASDKIPIIVLTQPTHLVSHGGLQKKGL